MAGRYWKLRRDLALAMCALPISTALAPSILFATEQPAAPAAQPGEITREQLEALIQQAGTTPPAWWDSTPLNVPDGMDMSWARTPAGPTDDKHVLRLYLFDYIFPNPDRWQEGAKLVQQSLTLAKDDPTAKANATIFLSMIYTEMLQDYARGAFWARKLGPNMNLRLAQCYLKLGCKPMAIELLNKLDPITYRDPGLIKTWAEAGDLKKALSIVDTMAKFNPGLTYLTAGEACRLAGKVPDAVTYYEKVLAPEARAAENVKRRASASLDAIKLYDSLDLEKIPDGKYSSGSIGYAGQVVVEVTVKDHRIMSAKVTDHHEKRFFSSIIDTTAQISLKQSVKGIDTTSGATITSEAIINASAKALSAAQK